VEFTLQAFKGKVRVTAGGKKYLVRKLWFPGEAIFSGPGIPPAQYRGEFEVTNLYGRLQIVNVLPMEGYLKNVIPAEMTPSFPKEALKAQAVAARTYAYQHLGKHGRQGFDFCDSTHCQVYLGIRKEDSRTAAIVEETAGMVLTYKGRLINAIYQSDCAGKTSNNETIFGGVSLTYLRGVDDKDYCKYSPYSKPWKVHFTKEELLKALKKDSRTNPGNNLNNIEVQKTDWAGRPITVKISGDNTKIVSGYYFWLIVGRTLSWSDFISTMYEIKKSGDGYEINGKGNGHGIGMCQWGAVGMAQRGFTYDKILEHYYPGTKLENAEKMNF
jgi:stage II sporulation protein D